MIRRLTPSDADAFFKLRLCQLEMHPEAFATTADAWRAATPEQLDATLASADSAQGSFVLGAFVDEELVGLVGFRRETRASVRHKGSLWGFFVHPSHRRQGFGTKLLRALIDLVTTWGDLSYLRLVVTTRGNDAVRAFRAQGFVLYGTELGGLRSGDAFFDQAFMRLDLQCDGATSEPL